MLLVPASADAAKRKSCTLKGGKIADSGPDWVLLARTDRDSGARELFACHRKIGRRVPVGATYSEGAYGAAMSQIIVRGRYFGAVVSEWDHSSSSAEVRVIDLRTGEGRTRSAGGLDCLGSIRNLVLARDGTAAFARSPGCPAALGRFTQIVRMSRLGRVQIAAEGETIDPKSLELEGRGLTWTESDGTHEAPLDVRTAADPCRPGESDPIALTAAMRVYRQEQYGIASYKACTYASGQTVDVEYPSSTFWGVRLGVAGTKIAFAGSSQEATSVHVLDATTGTTRAVWSRPATGNPCRVTVTDLDVADDGVAAFITRPDCYRDPDASRVWRARGDGVEDVLAEGADIDLDSLRILGRSVTWTARGAARSAPLD